MGPPDKLNDPFEGGFRIKNIKKYQNEYFIKKLLKFKRKSIFDDYDYDEDLNKSMNDEYYFSNILSEYINSLIMSEFGISCFTNNPESLKMWSHYADSHKGVCLIFDEVKLKTGISKQPNVSMNKIKYSNQLPFIELVKHDANEDSDDYIGIREEGPFLFNKLCSWIEEEETRLLINKNFDLFPDRRLKFDSESLVGIIFGARIGIDNFETIKNLIKEYKKYNNVKFYTSNKDIENSEIIIKEL
jgi:hypothetical protein